MVGHLKEWLVYFPLGWVISGEHKSIYISYSIEVHSVFEHMWSSGGGLAVSMVGLGGLLHFVVVFPLSMFFFCRSSSRGSGSWLQSHRRHGDKTLPIAWSSCICLAVYVFILALIYVWRRPGGIPLGSFDLGHRVQLWLCCTISLTAITPAEKRGSFFFIFVISQVSAGSCFQCYDMHCTPT